MKPVTKPKVRLLGQGNTFQAKQMAANAGDLLPKHLANLESVLVVVEGECILHLGGREHHLKAGDAFIVPPNEKHQIEAKEDFKAIHVMTNDIRFEFFS